LVKSEDEKILQNKKDRPVIIKDKF